MGSNRQYYTHLICTADTPDILLDKVSQALLDKAFFTKDLLAKKSQTVAYSRRCIDCCDYVLMLIADSYGQLTNTGVSQLHLSYVYAKTKNKPLVVFVKLHDEDENLTRQLQDFITLVEKQVDNIYYYDEETDIDELIDKGLQHLTQNYPVPGWQPALKVSGVPSQAHDAWHDRERDDQSIDQAIGASSSSAINLAATLAGATDLQAQTKTDSAFIESDKQVISPRNQSQHGNHTDANLQALAIGSEHKQSAMVKAIANSQEDSAINRAVVKNKTGATANQAADKTNLTTYVPAASLESETMAEGDDDSLLNEPALQNINLLDNIELRGTAHAYAQGNLKEVKFNIEVEWITILLSLIDLPSPFLLTGLQRSLNDVLAKFAQNDIQQRMPEVHAIARCQVAIPDIKRVKAGMKAMGWIVLVEPPLDDNKEWWQLSDTLMQELKALS